MTNDEGQKDEGKDETAPPHPSPLPRGGEGETGPARQGNRWRWIRRERKGPAGPEIVGGYAALRCRVIHARDIGGENTNRLTTAGEPTNPANVETEGITRLTGTVLSRFFDSGV